MADKLRVSIFIDPVQEPTLFAMMKSMRPFVRAEFIRTCLRERLEGTNAVTVAIPPQHTIQAVQEPPEPAKVGTSALWNPLFEPQVDIMGDDFD